jgi:acetylcholinesterase
VLLIAKGLSEANASVAASQLVSYYSSDPAAGSPYGTGNETFGQPPEFKRLAAISGDMYFTAAERFFQETISKTQPSWAGLMTQALPPPKMQFGVYHGTDLAFYFPNTAYSDGTFPAQLVGLKAQMESSIIGFIADLDPTSALPGACNTPPSWLDTVAGLTGWLIGTQWPVYGSTKDGAVLQWKANSTVLISDTYRQDGIQFINNVSLEIAGQ